MLGSEVQQPIKQVLGTFDCIRVQALDLANPNGGRREGTAFAQWR